MKRIFITALVGLLALAAFYMQRRGYSDQEHERFESALWRLKHLDATFNQDVLRARFSLLESYDAFHRDLAEMERLTAGLSATPRFVGEKGRGEIGRSAAHFGELLQRRRQLFERFKSRNAILANSRRYFPVALDELGQRLGESGPDRELNAILQDLTLTLIASGSSADEPSTQALGAPSRLQAWSTRYAPHAEAPFVASLVRHAHELLAGKNELDGITRQLLTLPTAGAIEKLSRRYEDELTTALRRSQHYRSLLYTVGALLVLVVGYALWTQREANRHLERRVAERTHQLQAEMDERRKSDEARRLSEAFLQSLVENLPVHIFRKDRAGRLTFANKRFCDWRRHSLSELLGKSAADLLPPAEAEKQRVTDETVMATGQIYEETEQQARRDGQVGFIHLIKVPIFDAAGQCTGVQGMFLDVTAQKRAEARFAEASGLLDTLLAGSPDHIYFKDRDSRFVRFSDAVLRRFGLSEAEKLHGKCDADFYGPDHARAALTDEQEIIRTGVPIVGKLEKETYADGHVTWALTTKMPWRDGAGRIVGTFGISKDVTALKEAEEKLAYERDQLRALLDSSPDMIYFKDLDSRLIRVSRSKVLATLERVSDLRARRAARELPVDVPEAELLNGLTDFDTYQNDDARLAFEDEQRIIRTGEPIIGKIEKQFYRDGTQRWRVTSKMPWRNRDGKTIGTFGLSKDITELKQAEEKLEQLHRQLLETSRQAGMAEVATGVLHNVGNVLNSVNVSATLIGDVVRQSKSANVAKLAALFDQHKANLADFLAHDARGQRVPGYLGSLAEMIDGERTGLLKELEQLRANIEHIKEIVAMQQAYARTSGVLETVAVPDLIEDALRMNAGSLARHEIETCRDYQARPTITTDKHKVMQILVNLVRNAKFACDESGRTDKQIVVRTTADARHVKIAVIDNGVGIPAENLIRIFNHGFTTRKNGHGFGLHSGALAAKELGGSLHVTSEGPGRGATFVLELPHTRETATS